MEELTLATPEIVPQIVTTSYRVASLTIDVERDVIVVAFRGTNGERREWQSTGTVAQNRIKALNTANLSVKSLHRRIMELAVADGVFSGSIAGTPDS